LPIENGFNFPFSILHFALNGVVAQLGERMNGIHEVRGSIPLDSTNIFNKSGQSILIALYIFRANFPPNFFKDFIY
jgi:hypothetical protein